MVKTEFKIDIILMRLIILNFLYFIVVMWQLMWITYMSRKFISEFPLYSYRGFRKQRPYI
jgi:hypothetical protein